MLELDEIGRPIGYLLLVERIPKLVLSLKGNYTLELTGL